MPLRSARPGEDPTMMHGSGGEVSRRHVVGRRAVLRGALATAGILGAMPKPAIENDGLAVADSRLDELSGGIDLARPIRHHGG